MAQVLDVSIVMPCLNEARSLRGCIEEAQAAISKADYQAEIIVADNNSTDNSIEIAKQLGTRIIRVPERGYGNALRGGIAAALSPIVVMGDADGSYDFSTVPLFVDRLRQGDDLVMGNRFNNRMEPGAMPWLHRYIGNPALSGVGRILFPSPAKDFHCGLRGIKKEAFDRLNLEAPGMEFASEMIICAYLAQLKISEIPIVLRRDQRTGPSHLRAWRDGWRHLRLMIQLAIRG